MFACLIILDTPVVARSPCSFWGLLDSLFKVNFREKDEKGTRIVKRLLGNLAFQRSTYLEMPVSRFLGHTYSSMVAMIEFRD